MSNFLSPTKIETTAFLTLGGTATSISKDGKYIYITQRSSPQGSRFVPLSDSDYSEILKIPVKDFFSGQGVPESLLSLKGAITAGCLSFDEKSLYFIHKKRNEDRSIGSHLCQFEFSTQDIKYLGAYRTTGNRLKDVDGRYLIEHGDVYASIKFHDSHEWIPLLPDIPARRSVFVRNDDVYYMIDNSIFYLDKSKILNHNFNPEKIYELDSSIDLGNIFVDDEGSVYVVKYGSESPVLINLHSKMNISIEDNDLKKGNSIVKVFFKDKDDYYCIFWGADRPLTKDTKILRIDEKNVEGTDLFARSPTFMCSIGNYLIFNHDEISKWQSKVFGIEYR